MMTKSEMRRLQQAIRAGIRRRLDHPIDAALSLGVIERFERVVARQPERPAISAEDQQLTYRQLAARVATIAHCVQAADCDRGRPVAIALGDSPWAIAAMLGVLAAGHFFTVIDERLPEKQITNVLHDCDAELLIGETRRLQRLRPLASATLRAVAVERLKEGARHAATPTDPDDPIWLCYTSGSIGRPKGVIQTHRNLLHTVAVDGRSLQIDRDDRLALLFSFSSNIAVHTIFDGLLHGASLHLWDVRQHAALECARWLEERQITQLWTTPTVAVHIFGEMAARERLNTLRVLQLVGEASRAAVIRLYADHTPPGCVLVNRFGSSETGPVARLFVDHACADRFLPPDGDSVSIGLTEQGNCVTLVDSQGKAVASGEVGEIVVHSRYLSPGYWKLPDKTTAVFAGAGDERCYRSGDLGRFEADGTLTHLGRKDYQIKIDGNKVALQAVEFALAGHPAVRHAAAWPYTGADGRQQLAGYVVFENGLSVSDGRLRSYLRQRLAAHAVPKRFVVLDRLPSAPNGKLYRPALPLPVRQRPRLDAPYSAPKTPVERTIIAIWRQVLQIDKIGVDDRFLALGGDSLEATRIAVRVRDTFAIDIGISELFSLATPKEMADRVFVMMLQSAQRE